MSRRGGGQQPRATAPPPPLAVSAPFSLVNALREIGGPPGSVSLRDAASSAAASSTPVSRGANPGAQIRALSTFLGSGVYSLVQVVEPPPLRRDSAVVVLRSQLSSQPGATVGTLIARPAAVLCVPGAGAASAIPKPDRGRSLPVGFFLLVSDEAFLRALLLLPVASIASPVVLVR